MRCDLCHEPMAPVRGCDSIPESSGWLCRACAHFVTMVPDSEEQDFSESGEPEWWVETGLDCWG